MRPDIVVEYVAGMYLFSAETDAGREWLASRPETTTLERIGRSIAAQTERDARDLISAAEADGLDVLQ